MEMSEGYVCFLYPESDDNLIPKANILVTDDQHFCLGDFGLTLVTDGQGLATTSSICGGSLRWMATMLKRPQGVMTAITYKVG